MIKATGWIGNLRLLYLGLSGENIARLMADEPITFNCAQLGLPPLQIVIMGGRTQAEIIKQMEDRKLVAKGLLKPIDERT